jgi:hypothetical protein
MVGRTEVDEVLLSTSLMCVSFAGIFFVDVCVYFHWNFVCVYMEKRAGREDRLGRGSFLCVFVYLCASVKKDTTLVQGE